MRLYSFRSGHAWAGSRLRRDESGIALVLAIAVMLVLAITLATVIFLTSSSARDAHRQNAGQKAYALSQAGLNNALAVLNANYPTTVPFPGDFTLLSGTASGEAGCTQTAPGQATANWCKSTYSTGTSWWSGTLAAAPTGSAWKYQWNLSAIGTVANPTGPGTSDVTRTSTVIVPVVIPDTTSINPTTSSLNWVYGANITFSQSVVVKSPVYATGNLTLNGSATISEQVPADANTPAHANAVNVLGNIIQANVGNNQNHIGRVVNNTEPSDELESVYVGGKCSILNQNSGALHDCVYNTTVPANNPDWIFAAAHTLKTVTTPSLTCCDSGDPSRPITFASPVDGTSHPATGGQPSVLGFWYNNADIGPNSPCATYTSTGSIPAPLTFDKQGVAQTALGADGILNTSATAGKPAFDLTPQNAAYQCVGQDPTKQLSWNGTNSTWNGIPKNTLEIDGTIFIDGSATASAGHSGGTKPAQYVGQGALILSGTYYMDTNSALCVNVTSSGCDTAAAWDPNKAGMYIFAAGDLGTDLSGNQKNTFSGDSIEINKGQYQGGLFGSKVVDASVTGTVSDGPMISAYADVFAGQSGILTFPAISFPTSGTDGFTGPFPIARLLSPRDFSGG